VYKTNRDAYKTNRDAPAYKTNRDVYKINRDAPAYKTNRDAYKANRGAPAYKTNRDAYKTNRDAPCVRACVQTVLCAVLCKVDACAEKKQGRTIYARAYKCASILLPAYYIFGPSVYHF